MRISKLVLLDCFLRIQHQWKKSHPLLRLEGKHSLNIWEASLSVNRVMDKEINVLQTRIPVSSWERKWIVLHNRLFWDSMSDKAFDGKVLPNRVLWGENIFDFLFKCLEIILYFGFFSLPGVGYMENYFHTYSNSALLIEKRLATLALLLSFSNHPVRLGNIMKFLLEKKAIMV